jgi:hypothetical protein
VILREAAAWKPETLTHRAPVFLATGEKEQAMAGSWRNENFPDDVIQRVRQVENFRELVALLAVHQGPHLALESAILAEEYHLTIFPAAFARGLRFVLDHPA